MRKIVNINGGWEFTQAGVTQTVDLPHTWNGIDGQGGTDTSEYWRGKCAYKKIIPDYEGRVYIEINGANTVCEVFVNGIYAGSHDNGYSMFRFEITNLLREGDNLLEINVDNSANEFLYPQMADFTFYGGLYRDVNIICEVADSHFALLDKSLCGVFITPRVDGKVFIKSLVEGSTDGLQKQLIITDAEGNEVASGFTAASTEAASLTVENVNLWNGMENPYLYTLTARLIRDGEIIDEVSDRFGFRAYNIDPETGFNLNGNRIKLKGVSRHQDRELLGNALTLKEHAEDIALIKEIGANSLRLAHYQHDKKFYDLCDEEGFLVWAEIPVISKFSKKKQPQARMMLEELIKQNYNRPSIFCWGVQNEISIAGASPTLLNGIRELNDLAHKLDSTRPTTCAQVSFCGTGSKLNEITDILGYNHYFGWYVQTVDALDEWLDKFHAEKPYLSLCLSEYGAEGITKLHSAHPVQGDYTEEYQALYHEHYIKAINERDWLWGSYVWNMFDFGSAIRNEGGVRGRNNKGLVTIDRKTKKDSFYAYKAFWSDEKFVHICGERFVDRPLGEQKIKVYSNCESVTLTVNGDETTLNGKGIFEFDAVIVEGENTVTAVSGDCAHEILINGTATENPDYKLPEGCESFVRNWFGADDEINPDKLSLDDSIGDIIENPEVQKLISNHLGKEVSIPGMQYLGKIPLKPVSAIASKTKRGKELVSLANKFLQTIDK
ncbi:MAG: hypothetical protein IKB88_03220 [Clostridia bacterium]|nr:hypothetical protein [Clostridia bacterium]